MPAVAFCAPILRGKEEIDRKGFKELLGPRPNQYDASRRRAGITREMVWHQETPDGTVAVVYLEADDIRRRCSPSRPRMTRSTSGSASW
jgi:hypothetical protein